MSIYSAIPLKEEVEQLRAYLKRKDSLSRRWVVFYVLVVGLCTLTIVGLRYNTTPSVPLGIYMRLPKGTTIERGDYVQACIAPGYEASIGLERRYLKPGAWDCEAAMAPLIKRVVAVGGDTIVVDTTGVYRNGTRVATAPKHADSQGRPMWVRYGKFVIPEGDYWLGSDSPQGYDSRYLGVFDRELILRETVLLLRLQGT